MDIRRRVIMSTKSNSSVNPGEGSYTITLNDQWRKSSTISNPDSTKYDGVYESYSNYNVSSGVAIMYIDIVGYTNFKLYIRSYAESNFDYVMVSQLDKTITGNSSYSNTTLIKAHTRGNQQSGTAIGSYKLVEFDNIDGGSHRITVLYRKDGSSHNNDDRGYLLIAGDSSGDIDIDTTYSITYTSSDGNIVTPYDTNCFDANIVSNTYINGQGIITFDTSVTLIGTEAFRSCSNLTSITSPDSVTSIGNTAFYQCKSLESIAFPDSVSSIGDSAFSGCESLTSVTIPNSVTSIGESVFVRCSSLTSFYGKYASSDNRCLIIDGVLNSCAHAGLTTYTIPYGVTSIGEYAFWDCGNLTSVTIPDGVKTIGNYAFSDCGNLTSVTIPDSVKTIEVAAFSGCINLNSISIPEGVIYIRALTFAYCNKLTNVIIPESIKYIDESAFKNCYKLTSVTIPDGVTYIGNYAFFNCSSLTRITIPNNVTYIGISAFAGCKNFTSITIPGSVTSIGSYTFQNCDSLTSVTIPDSVTWINEGLFDGCNSLTSITITENVTYIGRRAFCDCTSLTSITIPAKVTTIGDYAFDKCGSLKSVYCKRANVPKGGTNMFTNNYSTRKIYVPTTSVEAYKSAEYWSDYASYIVGYDF